MCSSCGCSRSGVSVSAGAVGEIHQPTRRTEMKKFGLGALLVAVGGWLFADHRRRAVVIGRIRALVAKTHPKQYDDATLKDKVESELFRDEHEVKGSISVNAQEGVVQLRGELPSQDLIDALVHRTRQIHGVKDVESLLHTRGTEAPMHH